MEILPASALDDDRYRVPRVEPGVSTLSGMAWLRAHVPRFVDGPEHRRRRALVDREIERVSVMPYRSSPTRTLLAAFGLDPELEAEVSTVAAAYQPHTPQSEQADRAADLLVELCGGREEGAAARVCVLVQAHAATLALINHLRRGIDGPPVPTTRRARPDGRLVLVDLSTAPFGRGPHRCPGEELAHRLAQEALR